MTDLIGERFGKLTVLEYIGNSQWKCRCDCGNITTATTTRLKRGEKTSCGCKIGGFQDLTGQRFGRLMVKKYAGKSRWICICDCGRETEAAANNLKNGHVTSCGCARGLGIVGQRFGKLTVLEQLDETHYMCRCDCGETCERNYGSLINGLTTTCSNCTKERRVKSTEKYFVEGTHLPQIKLDKKPPKTNKSGHIGVCWDKSRGKWMANIRFQGKRYNLGRFDHIQDAIDVREAAEKEIFGDFLTWYEDNKGK